MPFKNEEFSMSGPWLIGWQDWLFCRKLRLQGFVLIHSRRIFFGFRRVRIYCPWRYFFCRRGCDRKRRFLRLGLGGFGLGLGGFGLGLGGFRFGGFSLGLGGFRFAACCLFRRIHFFA